MQSTAKIPQDIQELLKQIKESYLNILQDNLIGIYIHGSLAMKCFNPRSSDVDFLVIVKKKLDLATKRKIVQLILKLVRPFPRNGLEMSIMLQSALDDFHYPAPFELHYSNYHREKYEQDPEYLCGDSKDPDLTAHLTVTFKRGFCLYGKPIKEVFNSLPEGDLLQALSYDQKGLTENILKDPIYHILNLCRTLCYLKEQKIPSKAEGGEWALNELPQKYRQIAEKALLIYQGKKKNTKWNKEELKQFVGFMKEEGAVLCKSVSKPSA